MGKPGVGKSTYLAYLSKQAIKKGKKVYSNVYIKDTFQFNIKDLGNFQIDNALVIIDEAGHEFNARDFKKFTNELYRFFTIHRHYGLDIVLAVQFWDRLDIVIRELTQRIVVVVPTLFKPLCIKTKDISVKIDISEDNTIVEKYAWLPFSFRYHLKRPLWKFFDSFYLDKLPDKQFNIWKSSLDYKDKSK